MKRQQARLVLLALLLLAFGLRLYRLDYQELRGDEAFGFFFSLRHYAEIVDATIKLNEPHPVASYFVQKSWMTLAGQSELALRFTTAWFGLLAVALIYRLGRRLALGESSSLGAMALMAVSPYLIWHAQDARMYSMSLALTLASTWLAVEWQQRGEDRLRWLWALSYVAVSWLALHTHYFAAFVLVAQYLFFVGVGLWLRQWRTLVQWLLIQSAVFLVYLPWLLRAGETLIAYGGNGDSPNFAAAMQRAASVFAAGESVQEDQRLGLALLALILLLLGTWRLFQAGTRTRQAALLLWLYLGIPLLATWLSALQRPVFNERYLVAAAPPFYLLISSVLIRPSAGAPNQRRWFRYSGALLLLLLLTGSLVSLNRHYYDPAYSKTRGWRDLAATIERYATGLPPDSVRLAQNFPDPTLWYYYDGLNEHLVLPPTPYDVDGAVESVGAMVESGVQRVILPAQPAPNWDDADIAQDALAEAFDRVHEAKIGVWPVHVYDLFNDDLFNVESTAVDITFENGVEIAAIALLPETVNPGGVLSVRVDWTGDNSVLDGREKVTLQLVGPDGKIVAQHDRSLDDAGRFSTSSIASETYGMLLPEALPSGDYCLIVALYRPDGGGSSRILTVAGEDAATLRQFSR